MKTKHIFSLLDTTFTTVHVIFSDTKLERKPASFFENLTDRTYCYKVPRNWFVSQGDILVVPAKEGSLRIVIVVTVDNEPNIDVDSNYEYKWAVQRIDENEHLGLNRREKEFHNHMLEIERTKQREELIESFRGSLPAGSAALALFERTAQELNRAGQVPPAPAPAPSTAPHASIMPMSGVNNGKS